MLFYVSDIAGKHAELAAQGMQTGPMSYPPHRPQGGFRLLDPDGYRLIMTHA